MRRAATCALAALLLAGCGSSGGGGTTAAGSGPGDVRVVLDEWTLVPKPASFKAGSVTFQAVNEGNVVHELVVVKTDKPANKLQKGAEADETGKVGTTGDIGGGDSKNLALTLQPGHYALICNLPGHYQAGQYADFSVR